MAELTVTEPCAGLGLPITEGACRLAACAPTPISAIAPFPGRLAEVDAALQAMGLGFPKPGASVASEGARAVWAGRATAFLMGAAPPEGLTEHAALTDQSDGWAGLQLTGAGAEAVLARLIPLDLRAPAFPPGSAARSLLNHMPCLVLRVADAAFELFTYRSMAGTAVHELAEAMRGVGARVAFR